MFKSNQVQQSGNLIEWQPGIKITWDDFKRKPDSTSRFNAVLVSRIEYKYEISDSIIDCYEIRNYMNSDRSWTKTKDSLSLEHELGHFNISEVFARKIRMILSEKMKSKVKIDVNALDRIVETYIDSSYIYQDKYDSSVYQNNIDTLVQLNWSSSINHQLDFLSQFSEPRVCRE